MRKTDSKLAVAYLRVSTPQQSTDQQRDEVQQWAAREAITIASWHVEVASGSTPVQHRAKLLEALQSLEQHRAGLLVATNRDRLARAAGQAAILEQLVADQRARVVTVDGRSDDDSMEGRLLRHILDAFAEFEAAKIAIRTKKAHANRRTKGLLPSGAPYGYRSEGVTPAKRLVPIPAEQLAIAEIRRLAKQGRSQLDIVAALQQQGHAPRGKRWHRTTVGRVLRHSV
jgi:DNA invertase Pin-like site-specific DNA recombinase